MSDAVTDALIARVLDPKRDDSDLLMLVMLVRDMKEELVVLQARVKVLECQIP